ncbi:MAG: hypothetical protein U9N51_12090 [Bacteroidota bacterium]|nr:hypothetical protein [Bacteroidota bacterium]
MLELGLGYTLYMRYLDNPSQLAEPGFYYMHFMFARIGYRYQNPKNGLFFKAAFLPYAAFDDFFLGGVIILPHIGIAVGKSF